jgi:uncharacterized membrane protein
VSTQSRYSAFIAYLLPGLGPLYVLLGQRRNEFALYHARQSLLLLLAALLLPLAWAVVSWLLIWLPIVGPVLGAALFALVLAGYTGLIVSWVLGLVYALRGRMEPLPLMGRWAARRPLPPPPPTTLANEPLEESRPIDA